MERITLFNNGEVTAITPALLQAILDALPAGIEMLKPVRDQNDKIVDFEYILENETIRQTPGYFRRVGKKFLTDNGGHDELVKKMARVIESGQSSQDISSGNLTDDVPWFDVKYIKYGDGIIVVRDNIPKKKLAEQSIEEDAHFIGQIVETSPDIIYIMDLNTLQIIYTNRQIAAELGYSKQQIDQMKNPLIDIMYEEDMPAFIEHLEKIKTSGSDHNVMEIEYRLKNAKGDIRWFCDRNTVFKRNSHNSPVEKLGLSQDITIRKEQEEQLRTDIGILSQAEEITNMGTWEYDIDTGNFKWSDGMYRLFNLSREELLSPEIYFEYTLAEEKETVTRITDNITRHYNAFDETITLLPSGQEKKIIRIRAVPVKDKGKNLVKMVGVDLDITSQVQASEEINELNKILIIKNRDLEELNSELKTFNTVTASDFKDTLQLLYTNLEYIARNETRHLGDSAKANLRRAQSAIQKMKLLTDDINTYLQLYDIGINVSLIDPNPILEQILSGIQEQIKESNASIEVSQLPTLLADPYLFSRLLMQLIDNAFKFRKLIQPPVIKIKYSQADEMNVVPLALKNTPYTIISVADNGIGFDDNESEKIFELFYRIPAKIKYKGSGIGLAICKKIMAMHHGFITSEGRPANGAVFSCYFPMDRKKSP